MARRLRSSPVPSVTTATMWPPGRPPPARQLTAVAVALEGRVGAALARRASSRAGAAGAQGSDRRARELGATADEADRARARARIVALVRGRPGRTCPPVGPYVHPVMELAPQTDAPMIPTAQRPGDTDLESRP